MRLRGNGGIAISSGVYNPCSLIHQASWLRLPVRLAVTEEQEETGWKYIHGDVFRPPPQLNLFAACVGTGTQILAMAVAIFALALVGVFYPYNRGALLTACVVSSLNMMEKQWQNVSKRGNQSAGSLRILDPRESVVHGRRSKLRALPLNSVWRLSSAS